MTVLNTNFAGAESDDAARTDFSFRLVRVLEYTNNRWFNRVDDPIVEREMKTETRRGGYGALNVWSTNTDYLGFATFPSPEPVAKDTDGVVINYGSVPAVRSSTTTRARR